MEAESSLPYSQAPAICPYPEPTPSRPHNPLHPTSWRCLNIILPSTSWSPQWSLSLRFPHQIQPLSIYNVVPEDGLEGPNHVEHLKIKTSYKNSLWILLVRFHIAVWCTVHTTLNWSRCYFKAFPDFPENLCVSPFSCLHDAALPFYSTHSGYLLYPNQSQFV